MHGSDKSLDAFKATLSQGMRLVWVLIMPASVGIFVLAQPIVALLFQRGAFTVESTAYTALALRSAVPGLIFAAIDQPLIYAFYAQHDTRTPTLVGVASTASYLVLLGVLYTLSATNLRVFTLTDLILANSLKTGLDACLMAIFLSRKIGGLRGYGMSTLAIKVGAASTLMGVIVWVVCSLIQARVGNTQFIANAMAAIGAAVVGVLVYLVCTVVLRVQELTAIRGMLKR